MSQGRRTAPLPPGWEHTRRRIARRDGNRCQLGYDGCLGVAPLGQGGETDHVIPTADGGDDTDANLQHVCSPCHRIKTGREARAHRRPSPSKRRPPEPHPGLA